MENLTIRRPDDWHVHLREGTVLKDACRDLSRYIGRAVVMPNLSKPVTNLKLAKEYYNDIKAAMELFPRQFTPLMTLYLTDKTSSQEIIEAAKSEIVCGIKLYPSGATTNSQSGVVDISALFPIFEIMQREKLNLMIHGEVTDSEIDPFDKEKLFIDRHLEPITKEFPDLKITFEHITTKDAVQFILDAGDNIASTITPHHLIYNRSDLFRGGIRPHLYCLPILKRSTHQTALLEAAISGNPKFFLGSDSAPHDIQSKESACGCAGIYSAHASLEFYTGVFDQMNALDKLEGFASEFGANFYGLPKNSDSVTLISEEWEIAEKLPIGEDWLIPMMSKEIVKWKVINQ